MRRLTRAVLSRNAIKMAIIQPAMAPHRFACFSSLAMRNDIELLVVYLRRGLQPYDWNTDERRAAFQRIELEASNLWRDFVIPLEVAKALRRFRPEVTIVGGWDEPSYFLVAELRPILRGRIAIWAESTSKDWRREGSFKTALKRRMLRRADAVVVPGTAARAYCESLGVSVRAWCLAPNAIDNELFASKSQAARDQGLKPVELPDPVFLYVGRLDPEKGVEVLLRSWAKIEEKVGGSLILAGTGRLESALKKLSAEIGLKRVHFAGFVPQADLPAWYALADAFVFPSLSDPWGLVINEAMACGLPVITTSAPGAALDLVREDVNGLVVAPGDEIVLAEAMLDMAVDMSLRKAMGKASARIIEGFSPNIWADAIVEMATQLT